MKKLFLSIIILSMCLAASAQHAQFGVKAGVNMSTMSVKSNNALNVDKNSMLTSFNVGVFGDISLGGNLLSFMPSLTLSGKGSKAEMVKINDNNYATMKYKPFFVDLQTNLVFNIPMGDDVKIFVGVGPYAAVGVFGKASLDAKVAGISVEKDYDINFTSNKADLSGSDYSGYVNMKRLDFGANAVVGVKFGKIVLLANYEHGLVNMQPGTADNKDDFGKNRSFNASVGFLF